MLSCWVQGITTTPTITNKESPHLMAWAFTSLLLWLLVFKVVILGLSQVRSKHFFSNMSLLNLYFISNYFSCSCYKGSTFQRETTIELPLFQSKLQHISYHRYGLCLNYIQRYSYSLFQLYTNASNVTTASGIIMNLSNNIKSSMSSIH